MRIAMGADHGGVTLKDDLAAGLRSAGHEVMDLGTNNTDSVDYPTSVAPTTRSRSVRDRGFSSVGRVKDGDDSEWGARIRAGVVSDAFSARMIVEHNNAQILALGARVVGPSLAEVIVEAFLAAEFEGGRHQRRVAKIAVH